jgi:hypothetical protein
MKREICWIAATARPLSHSAATAPRPRLLSNLAGPTQRPRNQRPNPSKAARHRMARVGAGEEILRQRNSTVPAADCYSHRRQVIGF